MTIHDMNNVAAIAIDPDLSVAVITKGASPVILGVFYVEKKRRPPERSKTSTNRHDRGRRKKYKRQLGFSSTVARVTFRLENECSRIGIPRTGLKLRHRSELSSLTRGCNV